MSTLENLIVIGGLLHLGTLLGSAQVPRELKFREELPRLSPLLQHWILVTGGYIAVDLVAFGIVSIYCTKELVSGTPLARAFCGFVAIFWGIRLLIAFFVFDAKPYLRNWFLRIGYHGLTAVFIYQTLVYGFAALH
jgi:hypothetical protein